MKDNHNHKILGVAEPTHLGQHSHQFALISNTCRYVGGNHLHEVVFTTSTSKDHWHTFSGLTTGAIDVGNYHLHFLQSVTDEEQGHRHYFKCVTDLA